jgi:transposase
VPILRGDHPAAGAIASDCPRTRRPGLLQHILFAKYGPHLPLNRQSAVYAREGIALDVSTLAD